MKNEIKEKLFAFQDLKYKEFTAKLIPNIEPDCIIGVRVPQIRAIAKEVYKMPNKEKFLSQLPHCFLEENHLHTFILNETKDYDECIVQLNRFLPFVDNWATCDSLRPKVFAKRREHLLNYIEIWLQSDHTYTVRFGMEMLMVHFLDDLFDTRYLQTVANIKSEDYYINMMIAWYFATALAKQYESARIYIEKRLLSQWVHKKTIQKAVESYRLSAEQKQYLKSFR